MNYGFGSIFSFSNIPPGGGAVPPFPLNAADNGLSVDPITLEIVLGQRVGAVGNPANFLDNREIPMNSFDLSFTDPAFFFPVLWLRPAAGFFFMGDAFKSQLILDEINQRTLLGNLAGNGTRLITDDINMLIEMYSNGVLSLQIDGANDAFNFGDVAGSINGTVLNIDDSQQRMQAFSNNAGMFDLNASTGRYLFGETFFGLSGLVLNIDSVADRIRLGDYSGITNGTFLDIDNNAQKVDINSNGNLYFDIDAVTGVFQFGDLNNANNGSRLFLNDTTRIFGVDFFTSGTTWIQIQDVAGLADFGNSSGAGNTTFIRIDDPNNEFKFSNGANNSKIRMNGTIGFTGTVTPVTSITVDGGIVTNVT